MRLNERLLVRFATDYAASDREGFLFKKGEVNKGFQKRFFVLRGNLLFYFEKKQDREPIGVIILDNCRIELCENDTSYFAFQIVFEGVGTRTYVLGAETEEEMKLWMTKLTHAEHVCMQTVVKDLEKRLADLQQREASMSTEVISESSSDSEVVEETDEDVATTSNQQTMPLALPKPPNNALQRAKCKTLPPRRNAGRQVDRVLQHSMSNRWSLSTDYPVRTSTSFSSQRTSAIDDLTNISERTDFLCEDFSPPSRHFSMSAFTPPSELHFSELKKYQELEDQNLTSTDNGGLPLASTNRPGLPFEKKIDTATLTDRPKGNRRAISLRRNKHGVAQGMRRDIGGSLHGLKRHPLDHLNQSEENRESTFQHLHRLWGATIWTKVREYEIQHSKPEAENNS